MRLRIQRFFLSFFFFLVCTHFFFFATGSFLNMESSGTGRLIEDIEKLLELSQQAEVLQEQNEELQVRLETLGSRVHSILDDMSYMREELEIRIARLELRSRQVKDPSMELIMQTRRAECAQYEDTWTDLRAKMQAIEASCNAASSMSMSTMVSGGDALDMVWLRSAVRNHITALRKSTPAGGADVATKQPSRAVSFRNTLHPNNNQTSSSGKKVTALRLSLLSMETNEEQTDGASLGCVFEVGTLKRRAMGSRSVHFANVLPQAHLRVSVGKWYSDPIVVADLLEAGESRISLGDGAVVVDVFADFVDRDLPEEEAMRHVVGIQSVPMNRGGAHVSVPRFVKKLKSLRQVRDNYTKLALSQPVAATVEEEFLKPLPDINWLQEQILGGWDGEPMLNTLGQTLLHLIAMVGSPRAVRSLLKRGNKWDPHLKDLNGWSPFMLMVARQFKEGIQMMLFNGARADDSVWGVSALHLAALSGNLDLVKTLLEHDAALATAVDDRLATPLHYACYGHRVEVVDFLAGICGCDARDLDGHSPLLTTLLRKSIPVCESLLAHGATVTHAELWAACLAGQEYVALLAQRTGIEDAASEHAGTWGHTVLHKCCMLLSDLQCCAVLPTLLRHAGLHCDVRDHQGRTALMYACMCGKPGALRLLLGAGADPLIKDVFGNLASHLCTTADACDALLEKRALFMHDPNLLEMKPVQVSIAIQSEAISVMLASGATWSWPEGLDQSHHYRIHVPFSPNDSADDFLR